MISNLYHLQKDICPQYLNRVKGLIYRKILFYNNDLSHPFIQRAIIKSERESVCVCVSVCERKRESEREREREKERERERDRDKQINI